MTVEAAFEEGLDIRTGKSPGKFGKLNCPVLSRWEIDATWKDFELELEGRVADFFARFMYQNYKDWEAVASSQPYKFMHDADEAANIALVPTAVLRIKREGIKAVVSLGPNPSLDKLYLEQLVRDEHLITYRPIDTNQEAAKASLGEVARHLTKVFGADVWKKYVSFNGKEPGSFGYVTSDEPSCVIISGGAIMNSRKLWEQAAKIANPGGIVVASAAVTPDLADWSEYWLSIYDTPEVKKMFKNALNPAFPELFTEENRDKWEIKFNYIKEARGWTDRFGLYQTPMVTIELYVKETMSLPIPDQETGTIEAITVKPSSERERPIILVTSSKLNTAAFLETVPRNFGLEPIGALDNGKYALSKIGYVRDGKQGIVAAAIFGVAKPPIDSVSAYDLEPGLRRR